MCNDSILCFDAELLEEFKDEIYWILIASTSIEWTRELHAQFEEFIPQEYDYDFIKETTFTNRKSFIEGTCSEPLPYKYLELCNYAKSKNEELWIVILYDAIQEYFDTSMTMEIAPKEISAGDHIALDNEIREAMQQKIREVYKYSPIFEFSRLYPFTMEQLEKWTDVVSWDGLSSNTILTWSSEMIRKFADRLLWDELLSNNSILCWDAELFDEFNNNIIWYSIIDKSIVWTTELHAVFEKYMPESLWSYDFIKEATAKNRNRNDSGQMLSNSMFQLYFFAQSIDKDRGKSILYDAIQDYLDSSMKREVTTKVEAEIEVITKKDSTIVQIGFVDELRIDMQEKIKELFNDSPIAEFSSYYPFELYQLEEWAAVLSWEDVGRNLRVKWSSEIIQKFEDKWDWIGLWINQSILCWDAELLEKYKDKLRWDVIICNSIDWTEELHTKFEKHLPWDDFTYHNVKGETAKNREWFIKRGSGSHMSEPLSELYYYAKSLDEKLGIFILYDAIQQYFDSRIREMN